MTLKTIIFTHRPHGSLARFTFCWCHNWLLMTSQWPDNCDLSMKKLYLTCYISIFNHSDIHGWSWKKTISFLNWRANSAALPPTKPLPWLPHGSHLPSTKAGDAYGYFRHDRSCLLHRWLLLVMDNIKSCKIQVMRHRWRKHFLWNTLFAKINSIITVTSHGHHGISDL